jgi:hypothetical protein
MSSEQFLKEIYDKELLVIRRASHQAKQVQVEQPGAEGEEGEEEEEEEMVNDQVNARALQICREQRHKSLHTLHM